MNTQLFLLHLKNQGILDNEQLKEAFEIAASTRVRLGTIAVERGLMSAQQTEQVNQKQKTMDKKFGEIAISEGYLTENDIEELLKIQEHNGVKLTQVLVDKYLSYSDLEKHLEQFRLKYGVLAGDSRHQEMDDFVAEIMMDKDDLVKDYFSLMVRSSIRFFDEPRVGVTINADGLNIKYLVAQDIKGNGRVIKTMLAIDSDDLALYLSNRFSGLKLGAMDELAEDALKECLNTINGIFIVNMSSKNTVLKLEAPLMLKEGLEEMDFTDTVCLPLEMKAGVLYILYSN